MPYDFRPTANGLCIAVAAYEQMNRTTFQFVRVCLYRCTLLYAFLLFSTFRNSINAINPKKIKTFKRTLQLRASYMPELSLLHSGKLWMWRDSRLFRWEWRGPLQQYFIYWYVIKITFLFRRLSADNNFRVRALAITLNYNRISNSYWFVYHWCR